MLPLIKVKFCQCWYIVCGIPWQSATSLLPLLRIFCGVTWCAVSSVFTEHRLQLCFRRGWWAVMAFLQRQERNKERSVLFHAFLYSTQVETCLCGWTPIAARLSLSLSCGWMSLWCPAVWAKRRRHSAVLNWERGAEMKDRTVRNHPVLPP